MPSFSTITLFTFHTSKYTKTKEYKTVQKASWPERSTTFHKNMTKTLTCIHQKMPAMIFYICLCVYLSCQVLYKFSFEREYLFKREPIMCTSQEVHVHCRIKTHKHHFVLEFTTFSQNSLVNYFMQIFSVEVIQISFLFHRSDLKGEFVIKCRPSHLKTYARW